MKKSLSGQEFLMRIWVFAHEGGFKVTAAVLAKKLMMPTSQVNALIVRLSRKGLLKHQKYQELRLTTQGTAVALRTLRIQRLWETFLHQQLHLDLRSAFIEAERMGHMASDEMVDRLSTFLGNPLFDPHGDPIPTAHGGIPIHDGAIRLNESQVGDMAKVVRLSYHSAVASGFYDRAGLAIGSIVKILSVDDAFKIIDIEVDEEVFGVGEELSGMIYIQRIP
jgi:DtxR family Mn-dependent transcriptional regulator